MRRFNRIVWPGILALVFSGAVMAHDYGGYIGYPNNGLAGSVTIWGNSVGQSGYAGNLSYGVAYAYAPGYTPWLTDRHGPQCQHGPNYHHPRGYRHAYKHGYKHGRKHKGRHH